MIGSAAASRCAAESTGQLASDIAALPGGDRVHRCGQTGACTSACPVTTVEPRFNPRRFIHLVQQGFEGDLLRDEDVAELCLACGKCSAACPRAADPQGILAALNRWLELKGHTPRSPARNFDAMLTAEVIQHGRVDHGALLAALAAGSDRAQHDPAMVRTLQSAPQWLEPKRGLLSSLFKKPGLKGWAKSRAALQELLRVREAGGAPGTSGRQHATAPPPPTAHR